MALCYLIKKAVRLPVLRELLAERVFENSVRRRFARWQTLSIRVLEAVPSSGFAMKGWGCIVAGTGGGIFFTSPRNGVEVLPRTQRFPSGPVRPSTSI